jgi:hypothetical protein
MKQIPSILATGFNKARKRRLALLFGVAVLVGAADLALVAVQHYRETASRDTMADFPSPQRLDVASASAADPTLPAEAAAIPPAAGWIDLPLRWFHFSMPYGDEKGGPSDFGGDLPILPSR